MKTLREFLSAVHISKTLTQFGGVNRVLFEKGNLEEFVNANKNKDIYFLTGVDPKKTGERAKDIDIIRRKHIAFDFDIRKDKKITDERIKEIGAEAAVKMQESKMFNDFSAVVFSGNGFHVYFVGDEIEADKDRFSAGMEFLNEELEKIVGIKPDPACKNIGRIFRLPASFNNKNEQKKVEFIYWEKRKSDLVKNLYQFKKVEKKEIKPVVPLAEGQNLWEAAFNLDCKMALQRLSGTAAVQHQVFTFTKRAGGGENIVVSGKKDCDCWLDPQGRIGSGKRGGPSITQWIRFYDWSWKETAEILKREFEDLLPKSAGGETPPPPKEEIVKCGQSILERYEKKREPNKKTWGVDNLDLSFKKPRSAEYILFLGEPGQGKTTYCLQMAIENAKRGIKVLFFSLEMAREFLEERYLDTYAEISEEQKERAEYTSAQKKKMVESAKELEHENLTIVDSSNIKTKRDIGVIESMAEDYELIFIDNFSYIVPRENKEEVSSQSEASEKILNLVNRTKKTVVLIHHYAKKTGNTRGLEARGSQKLIDDCTIHASIDSDEETPHIVNFRIKKGRYIKTGSQTIFFRKGKYFPKKLRETSWDAIPDLAI